MYPDPTQRRDQATFAGKLSSRGMPLLLILIGLFHSGICRAQAKPTTTPTAIYDRTHSSIVVIVTADKDDKPVGQGSGFIVARDRIATNHHVFEGAANAVVFYADGASVLVEGIFADSPARDLVILSAQTGSRSPLRLGNELSVRQGDAVYAIGAPQGLQLSITNGIVSGFRQVDEQFMIQSTAPIAPGSSGGPLFDSEGHVIGVTTSLLNGSPGIYFSIGAGDVSRLLRTPNAFVIPFASWSEKNATATKSESSPDVEAVQKLINEKNYGPAKERLTGLLEKTPNDSSLHKMMGEVDLFQGDTKSALAHLKTALDAKPDDVEVQSFYAFALYLTGRYGEAAQYQESLVKTTPTDFNLGFLSKTYYAEKKFKEAEDVALRALQKNPSEETALSVIAGNVYWGRSSSQLSWADLQSRLAKISQDSFWVKINRAIDLARQSKDQEATNILQGAKKDTFSDPVLHSMLSYIYEKNNQIGMARDEVQEGLGEFPDDLRLLETGVMVDLLSHDDTGAYRNASRLFQIAQGTREELYASCLYTYGTGQSSNAISNCSTLAQTYPKDHTAHSNLAWAALDADQFSLARQEFGQAYALVAEKWNTLTYTEVIDLVWGTAIADYFNGDKKTCKKLLQFMRKDYPSALTVTGLQQLPLIWSNRTMTRIESILREIKP
jgi:tetratricopeptide (TPR) repeat protein